MNSCEPSPGDWQRWRNTKARRRVSQLAAIVESSDDAIIAKSLDGIILRWNAGAERIYGYTAEEVTGKHISIRTTGTGHCDGE